MLNLALASILLLPGTATAAADNEPVQADVIIRGATLSA